ncbi:hypothetical protein [Acinetobacter variabilis]|uniref:Uncharacterized protein n=1 Tax=Acinetobacter variabilis TaxID=70346 RepID=N8VLI5_9GAMM|nr:hypothetical protein [Acinetobacter variabilis]ENV00396.1 hypothetical protein F969_00628 [Acinetobacter variabilis]
MSKKKLQNLRILINPDQCLLTDFEKEREAFELSFKETDFYKMNLVNCFCFIADRYVWDEVQSAWEMWQTAVARMKVRINTLDEMLLNQGEALAQAKAQAVPEGFVLVKKELPEQIAEKMAIDRIDKPRHENDPVWSEIAEQSYKDQVKSKKWEFWRDYKAMIEAQEPAND